MNEQTRRRFLLQGLCGAGALGLRSLASGVPMWLLQHPERALAQTMPAASSFHNPQFLILNTSQAGDPLNCNAPGTYLDPKIAHPADPRLAKTQIMVGGQAYDAATPWTSMSSWFDRTSFIHHSTETEQHLHEPDVLGLMGSVVNKDMAVSAFAAQLAPVLGTIQAQPVVIGTTDSSEAISFQGRPQPLLNPMSLATVLGKASGPLGNLQSLRDRDLNRLNAFFKAHGSSAQAKLIDSYANSQNETRQIASDLLSQLTSIKDNGADSQMQAAIVLIKMKVAPVITVHVPFGGDNHFDGDLSKESDETVSGMATFAGLIESLADAQLSDQVTFASLNVFGRTLTMQGAGRSHNRNHHMTLLIGKNVKGSVIGAVTPMDTDYGTLPISSTTGKGDKSGDIQPVDSLAAVGKTLGVALGIPRATVDTIVVPPAGGQSAGKVISAAVSEG